MYYQKEIYTPEATVLNLRTQLRWTQKACAKQFEVSIRTWQRWETENKLSSAGREFLFYKTGFLTANRKASFFGAKYVPNNQNKKSENNEHVLMLNDDEIHDSAPYMLRNLKIWLDRKNNENESLLKQLNTLKERLGTMVLKPANDEITRLTDNIIRKK